MNYLTYLFAIGPFPHDPTDFAERAGHIAKELGAPPSDLFIIGNADRTDCALIAKFPESTDPANLALAARVVGAYARGEYKYLDPFNDDDKTLMARLQEQQDAALKARAADARKAFGF